MRETINTIAQVVMAICAVGVLIATLWKIPKHIDTKIAVLRLVFTFTSAASFAFCIYFATFTNVSMGIPTLLALYTLIVDAVLFLTSRGSVSRGEILSMILTAAFVISVPGMSAINHILGIQGRMIGILEKMNQDP